MTLEKLKELLEEGRITQEEFDELANNLKGPVPVPTPEPEPEPEPEPTPEPLDLGQLDKIVQAKVDKKLAQVRKEKVELERKLERFKKAKLTEDELRQEEIDEKEKAIAEREKAIADKENRLYAMKAIKSAGLDDGSDVSLSLIDFVMGEDETEIDDKVKAFKELFDKAVSAEVNKRFKEDGYIPKKGNALNGGKNPWAKDQHNLTEQMVIESTNPELAAQLKAAAGVN